MQIPINTRFIFGAMLFLLTTAIQAQSSFSISPSDTVYASKPASWPVFYNYVQFENNTNDTLQMRWEITERIIENNMVPSGQLGAWQTPINDPTNIFTSANNLLTADFFLVPETSAFDKLIYQLLPNNQTGLLVTTFKIFPIDNPTDFVEVTFHYTALEDPNSTISLTQQPLKIYPNPVRDFLMIQNEQASSVDVQVFDMLGKLKMKETIEGQQIENISTTEWDTGYYFIQVQKESQIYTQRIIVAR